VVSRVADDFPGPAPGAAELAVPLSIAVRIEPELVRAIRLAILPYLDVAAESDLWFSDLVASRGPDSIILKPEVLPGLRAQLADRLARSAPGDSIRSVGDIVTRIHASASPALLLEERVAWLAVSQREGGGPAIEDELRTVLYALQVQRRTGIADWVAGAWTRLPESVRGTKTGWQLRQAASLHVDMSRLPLGVVPAGIGVADLAGFVADIADVPLGVRLSGGALEIGDIGTPPGAVGVPTLDTDPRIVELLPDGRRTGRTIAVPRGGSLSMAIGPGPARLLTPRGLVYEVTPYVADYRLVQLPGSERQPLPDVRAGGPLEAKIPLEVTLVLRRRSQLPSEYVDGPATLTREELAARYGADQADITLVQDVLSVRGLSVTAADAASRRVHVAGEVGTLAAAFGVSLRRVTSLPFAGSEPVEHRYREGPVFLPAELDGIVFAVLGLDDRPCLQQAEPDRSSTAGVRAEAPARPAGQPFTPPQVGACYAFPSDVDGRGQTLAIVGLDGGFSRGDLDQYLSGLGIVPPRVTAIGVDGSAQVAGRSGPGGAQVAVEVAGALAPGADQLVYFAPNTDRGLFESVSAAVYASQTPTAVCIGWGQLENSWTAQAISALDGVLADAAALGVTVCVAAGDGGSGAGRQDGLSYACFPASSPHALACGGTRLLADPATGLVFSETVWNDGTGLAAGGGISDVFPVPAWQAHVGLPSHADGGGVGRGVPDVAGNADPATGYIVRLDGQVTVVGGTEVVAALWAALVCLLAQATGRRFGLLQPLLYADASPGTTPPGFRDITSGNNGAYQAGPGWDACTGLGVPDGAALLERLASQIARQ
jgi:kumamolisin